MLLSNCLRRSFDLGHPGCNETAFALWRIMELAGESRGNAAAPLMTHHDNLGNAQLGHSKFKRGRDTMAPTTGLERWHQIGDVADDENLAGIGVENGGGVGAVVPGVNPITGAVVGAVLGGVAGAVIKGKQYYRDTRGYCYYVDQYGNPIYDYNARC